MRRARAIDGASAIARVLRAEGLAAVRDRFWDRARDAAARARCVNGGPGPWPAADILNVIGVPMTPIFGGVPLQLRARLGRESMLRPVALLSREPGSRRVDHAGSTASAGSSDPRDIGRDRGRGRDGWRLELWSDGRPRRAMAFPGGVWNGDPLRDDPAWLHAVRTCASLVNAHAIHVENAAGLSLVSLAELAGIGRSATGPHIPLSPLAREALPVVLSVHDFSLFRRDPHLLVTPVDSHSSANADERSPGGESADGESADADEHRGDGARHQALGIDILRAATLTIYPSQFTRASVELLLADTRVRPPGPLHPPAHVIAPGIELPTHLPRFARQGDRHDQSDQGDRNRRDQIAILGGGQEHKGGRRLPGLAAALVARGMHVTSYGGYGHDHLLALRRVSGVHVRGYYRAGSLPGLLARQRATVALILSAVPESFSLVLSEAWAAGVPVIAPASGAFIERLRTDRITTDVVEAGSNSSTAAPGSTRHPASGGLLLSGDPSDAEILDAVDRARRMSWDTLPAPPTAAQAADHHLALYRAAGFMTVSAS
jgi:glycosyltransferase involved in cell wall biosynthesis